MLTSRADTHRGALEAIDRFVHSQPTSEGVLQRTVELLEERFDHYSWVGVYLVERDELVLGAWQGPQPTEHVRIPIGEGVCGAAVASGRTEVVDDVAADPRYLRCFAWTRSEIVVPIYFRGEIVGEIDVDSDDSAAFDDEDVAFLEHVARMISSRCSD
jgi:GAF domain-containing protein